MERSRSLGSSPESFQTVPSPNLEYQGSNVLDHWVGRWPDIGYGVYRQDYRTVDLVNRHVPASSNDAETMLDIVGARSSYNPINHTKYRSILIPAYTSPWFTLRSQPPAGTEGSWWTLRACRKIPDFSFDVSRRCALSCPNPGISVDWSSLVSDVGEQLDGRMKASSLLLTSIIEMGQTVEMLRNPFNIKQLKRLRKRFGKKPLSSVAREASNAWLEYRYGWSNLYRDIANIGSSWNEVKTHLNYLKSTFGTYVPLSSAKTSVTTPSYTYLPYSDADDKSMSITVDAHQVVTTARFSLNIMRDAAIRQFTAVELLQQRLGVNSIVETLWDIVPFSFVIDWFINIGNFLRTDPIFWDRFHIRRMGYSMKSYYNVRLKCTYFVNPVSASLIQDTFVDFQTYKSTYVRNPGFPSNSESSGVFGSLSKTHLMDLSAIILQRAL